jgi:hypothetical protein
MGAKEGPGQSHSFNLQPSLSTRRPVTALRSCTIQAHDAVGHRLESGARYGLPADIAVTVGALVELAQRSFEPGQRALQRLTHPDLGKPADRLGRPVADPLAEALCATQLRSLCQVRYASPRVVSPLFEGLTDLLEIEMLGGFGHT